MEAGGAGHDSDAAQGPDHGDAKAGEHGGEAAGGGANGAAGAAAPPIAAKLSGVGRKIFRRAGTPQTGAVAKDNPQAKDDTVAPPSLDNPVLHPYFNTFKSRVTALAATGHVAIGTLPSLTRNDRGSHCNEVKAAAPAMADKAAYSNFTKGWLDMSSPKFQEAMGHFAKLGAELAKLGSSQFAKANSFGFWSKDEGRALAKPRRILTLETSSVGSLMDGLPTLDGKKAGWDPEIWGALSNAYANAVVPQVVKGKKVQVCVGADVTSGNIWETSSPRRSTRAWARPASRSSRSRPTSAQRPRPRRIARRSIRRRTSAACRAASTRVRIARRRRRRPRRTLPSLTDK